MDNDTSCNRTLSLPPELSDDLGEILQAETECPGVYYVLAKADGVETANEYYLIHRSSPYISKEAKSYGIPLVRNPEYLSVPINDPHSGGAIIRYEIGKYLTQHHQPIPGGDSLRSIAAYAQEDYPEYFGTYPAPLFTPRGCTTRYISLTNGVFVLETGLCEVLVAVCYPLWNSVLSSYVVSLAEQTEFDRTRGIDTTLGFLFFPKESAPLALFELAEGTPYLLKSDLIDRTAMLNVIWRDFPEYVIRYNRDEQAGLHDLLGVMARTLGNDVQLSIHQENLISWTEGVGTDWLHF